MEASHFSPLVVLPTERIRVKDENLMGCLEAHVCADTRNEDSLTIEVAARGQRCNFKLDEDADLKHHFIAGSTEAKFGEIWMWYKMSAKVE